MNLYEILERMNNKELNLNEANLGDLHKKTQAEKPQIEQRAQNLLTKVRFYGISDNGIALNFKVNSETLPGKFWYVTIDAPSILSFKSLYENPKTHNNPTLFTEKEYNELLLKDDFRVHCTCPDFLYGGNAYMATMGDYDIEKETRDPIIRNPQHLGALDKHTQAVVRCMYDTPKIKKQIIETINKDLLALNGVSNVNTIEPNKLKQIVNRQRQQKWRTDPKSYIDLYFARKAKAHPFLDDKDIKHSLKMEINKYIHNNPNATVDDYLEQSFNMTKDSFADDMELDKQEIDNYFDELGFTSKVEKAQNKQNNLANIIHQEEPEPEITPNEEAPTEEIPEEPNDNKPNIL